MNCKQALADRLRCREIWVEGSFKHRNPDEDFPKDFEENIEEQFDILSLPLESDKFIVQLKKAFTDALSSLNDNKNVRINAQNGGRIVVTPLSPQAESKNVSTIKKHLQEKWEGTN